MPGVDTTQLLLVGLVVAAGLVGVLVPVLPGLVLVWAAVLVWALLETGTLRWMVLAAVSVLCAGGLVAKYLVAERRMRSSQVPRRSVVVGALLGVVGFFVVPVVGLVLGLLAGVYAAERIRTGRAREAWGSTRSAMAAVGMAVLVELSAGLLAAGAWLAGALALS